MTAEDKIEYLACWLYINSLSVDNNKEYLIPSWSSLGHLRDHYLNMSMALLLKRNDIFERLFDESEINKMEKPKI